MRALHFESQVGNDGVLSLQVVLGPAEANAKVRVTIERAPGDQDRQQSSDWHEFVARTYGSCAGLGLEEPDDLPLQTRELPS